MPGAGCPLLCTKHLNKRIYIDWDAYWYGDCVSLVVSSYYGGTDPIYSQGWCFDFAAGHKLSVTELLMRMGLDPDET